VAKKEKTTTSSKTKVSEKLLSSKGNKPDMFADQVLEERSVDGSLASNPDDQQDGEGKETRRWARSRKPKKAKVDIGTELDSETLRS
jgi:hypothetical protein